MTRTLEKSLVWLGVLLFWLVPLFFSLYMHLELLEPSSWERALLSEQENPFAFWFEKKNFFSMLGRSLSIGLGASFLSYFLAKKIFYAWVFKKRLSPAFTSLGLCLGRKTNQIFFLLILAMPYLSLALAAKALFMERGWLWRLASSLTGIEAFNLSSDALPLVFSVVTLSLKQTFFFLYVLQTKWQASYHNYAKQAFSLGYRAPEVYQRVFLPLLYPHLRYPFLIVLSYSLFSVEVPLLFLNSTAPSLSLALLDLFYHPSNLDFLPYFFSGAFLLLVLFAGLAFSLYLLEKIYLKVQNFFRYQGAQAYSRQLLSRFRGRLSFGWSKSLFVLVLGCWWLIVWMLLQDAFFIKSPYPSLALSLDLEGAFEGFSMLIPLVNTLLLAFTSAVIACIFSLYLLERLNFKLDRVLLPSMLFLLVLPEISFILSFKVLSDLFLPDVVWPSLLMGHMFYVFSYVYLLLHAQGKLYDARYSFVGRSLGKNSWWVYWKIKLPILQNSVRTAFAIGFSVSCSLYVTTLFLAGGRVPTLTTETMAILSSYQLKQAAITAGTLSLAPFLMFLIAAPSLFVWKDNEPA